MAGRTGRLNRWGSASLARSHILGPAAQQLPLELLLFLDAAQRPLEAGQPLLQLEQLLGRGRLRCPRRLRGRKLRDRLHDRLHHDVPDDGSQRYGKRRHRNENPEFFHVASPCWFGCARWNMRAGPTIHRPLPRRCATGHLCRPPATPKEDRRWSDSSSCPLPCSCPHSTRRRRKPFTRSPSPTRSTTRLRSLRRSGGCPRGRSSSGWPGRPPAATPSTSSPRTSTP